MAALSGKDGSDRVSVCKYPKGDVWLVVANEKMDCGGSGGARDESYGRAGVMDPVEEQIDSQMQNFRIS